jgi:hypothetical protein
MRGGGKMKRSIGEGIKERKVPRGKRMGRAHPFSLLSC